MLYTAVRIKNCTPAIKVAYEKNTDDFSVTKGIYHMLPTNPPFLSVKINGTQKMTVVSP